MDRPNAARPRPRHPSPATVALSHRALAAAALALASLAGCGSSDDTTGEPGGQAGTSAGVSGASGHGGSAAGAAGAAGVAGAAGAAGASGQGGSAAGASGASGQSGGPALDLSKLTAQCFQGGTTPDVKLGDQFTDATWNDPHLLKVGATYWMYASSNKGLAGATPVEPYRLTSSDATHWTLDPTTPVLTAGADGAWDHGGVETPAVVSFGGKYHLFYTGYAAPHGTESPLDYRIGHATSPDGVSWTRDAAPILAPSDPKVSFAQYIVGEPAPVVVGDTLHLYFTAVGVDVPLQKTLQTIGLVTSQDGVTWSEPVLALSPDQTVYPRTDNWVGYSTPNAVVLGGQVHLFVDVANDHGKDTWTQEALHHAWSADGRTGWTQDAAPLRRKSDFTWTAREIRSPAALLDGTTLRLAFAGDDYFATKAWGLGQMTCSLAP